MHKRQKGSSGKIERRKAYINSQSLKKKKRIPFIFLIFYIKLFLKMNHPNIDILLWNCRGYKNKKNEIKERINIYDIIILTETKSNIQQMGFIFQDTKQLQKKV